MKKLMIILMAAFVLTSCHFTKSHIEQDVIIYGTNPELVTYAWSYGSIVKSWHDDIYRHETIGYDSAYTTDFVYGYSKEYKAMVYHYTGDSILELIPVTKWMVRTDIQNIKCSRYNQAEELLKEMERVDNLKCD